MSSSYAYETDSPYLHIDGMTEDNRVTSDLWSLPNNLCTKAEKIPLLYYDNDNNLVEDTKMVKLWDRERGLDLGTVGVKYKVSDHQEIAEKTTEAIVTQESFDSSGAIVNDFSVQDGRGWIREVTFPNESFYVGGEEHQFRLYIKNGYGYIYSVNMFGGPMRLQCFNGMFIGRAAFRYAHKHTANLNVALMCGKLGAAVHRFRESQEDFDVYQKTHITRIEALKFLRETICLVKRKNHEATYNKARLDQIVAAIDLPSERHAMSVWDMLNGMTAWATHQPSERGDINTVRQQRLSEVQRATSGDRFKQLLPTA